MTTKYAIISKLMTNSDATLMTLEICGLFFFLVLIKPRRLAINGIVENAVITERLMVELAYRKELKRKIQKAEIAANNAAAKSAAVPFTTPRVFLSPK